MFCLTVDVPEPFSSAIKSSQAKSASDEAADTPESLFGRGITRMITGRVDEARSDFLAAQAELGDACSIELACLRLQAHGTAHEVASELESIVTRTDPKGRIAARARHILGQAHERLGNLEAAVDALHRAASTYRELDEPLGVAHVHTSHGQLESARGRHDIAAQYFALSLVEKALANDKYGMAVTLGELGRANLDAGRVRDAISCFQSDLNICRQIDDQRGIAKMHGDLGRAYSLAGDYATADSHLQQALALSQTGNFHGITFFALKDLARNHTRSGRLNEADRALEAAKQSLPATHEPYLQAMLSEALGELQLAQGHIDTAIESLGAAVDGYEQEHLPDQEIAARITLARAQAEEGYLAAAEQCLCRGMRFARMEGYARCLRDLREEMNRLGAVESAVEETDRQLDDRDSAVVSSYIKLNRLGSGAYGEVFRVFDSWRGDVFALKVLHLEELYDVEQREKLIASAKTEILAASRVRHPGIVRVYKLGTFPEGQTYIVQDYVEGTPLSDVISANGSPNIGEVLNCVAQIADALQALHGAGVVHRDLKPSNVIVRPGHGPVLVDFGIAYVPAESATAERRIRGTWDYMAPEQAMGSPADGAADIYSLGVLAFQWLAGALPLNLSGSTSAELVQEITTQAPALLSDVLPQVDSNLEKLVMSMLAKKPRHRPSSAKQVATQLRDLARGISDGA